MFFKTPRFSYNLARFVPEQCSRTMTATFIPEIDNYVNKDGGCNIFIRITVSRVKKRVKTGLVIDPKHWNPEKREVRRSYPQHIQFNAIIQDKIGELQQIYLKDLAMQRPVTSAALQNKITGKAISGSNSFFEYFESKIALLPSPASRKNQTSVLKKLKDYRKGKDLLFSEITTEFLNKYRNHLSKNLGNAPNTVHLNITKIKTAYEEAVDAGLYEYEKVSPFRRVKLQTTKSKRTKLKETQIEILEAAEVVAGSQEFHAKSIFLFAFYLQGMRVTDVLQLTWSQIKDGRMHYAANKTKKSRSRIIMPKADAILEYYRHASIYTKPKDYVFPYLRGLKRKEHSEDAWLQRIDSRNSQIRTNLNKVAAKAGLPPISMHVARHSFADIAKKKTGNIYLVSDALDHGDLQTTVNYYNAAEPEENDDFVRTVFGED